LIIPAASTSGSSRNARRISSLRCTRNVATSSSGTPAQLSCMATVRT
jgi:hypothetical protein